MNCRGEEQMSIFVTWDREMLRPTGLTTPQCATNSYYVRASACSLMPRALMTLRIVSIPGLLSPDKAL